MRATAPIYPLLSEYPWVNSTDLATRPEEGKRGESVASEVARDG